MLVACWSVKGGVGTTVVAAAIAVVQARQGGEVLAVDLAGDLPHALGQPDPVGPGLAEWLAAGPSVPADALARLAQPVATGLALVARGEGRLGADRADVLADLLAARAGSVVADLGRIEPGAAVAGALAARAERSLLVLRPCQLALHRAVHLPVQPTGVVVVREAARALTAADVGRALGVPVLAELAVDPAVARAVDAGMLVARFPRSFAAAVEQLA